MPHHTFRIDPTRLTPVGFCACGWSIFAYSEAARDEAYARHLRETVKRTDVATRPRLT